MIKSTAFRFGAVLGSVFVAFLLMGLVADKNLAPNARTTVLYIPTYHHVGTSTGASTMGRLGMLARASIDTDVTPVWTSSIGAMPYAARLDIRLYDGNSDDTLTCTKVELWGTTGLGLDVRESVESITESEALSAHSYSSLTKFKATGCSAGGDSNDFLLIRTSDHIGLPREVRVNTDVISVCRIRRAPRKPSTGTIGTDENADDGTMHCGKGSGYTINTKANSIDLVATTTISNVAISDRQPVQITVRGAPW